jgi:hypothetical protein
MPEGGQSMPGNTRLTFIHVALLAVATIILLGLAAQGISRAATPVLAPGVESLAIDDKSVTAPTATVDVANSTPAISGRILPGKSTAVLGIDGSIEWEITVDAATGEFSTVAPQPVGAGTHTLTIDDVTVATFNVVAELPATGAGGASSGGNGFSAQPWLFVLAGLGLGVGVFLIARRRVPHL